MFHTLSDHCHTNMNHFITNLLRENHIQSRIALISSENNIDSNLNSYPCQPLIKKQLIEENFVKIDFVLDNSAFLEHTEVPKYSIFSFIGTLGGALNLWTDITVVVIIEILETMFNIIGSCISRNNPNI